MEPFSKKTSTIKVLSGKRYITNQSVSRNCNKRANNLKMNSKRLGRAVKMDS